MPYVSQLKLIKKDKKLTDRRVSELGGVPLPTITRVFNGTTPNPTFETMVGIAKALEISLDELAGLKPPANSPNPNSHPELLKEKDERIIELKDQNSKLEAEVKEVRHEKHMIASALIAIVAILVIGLLIDLCNGHIGHFRY